MSSIRRNKIYPNSDIREECQGDSVVVVATENGRLKSYLCDIGSTKHDLLLDERLFTVATAYEGVNNEAARKIAEQTCDGLELICDWNALDSLVIKK